MSKFAALAFLTIAAFVPPMRASDRFQPVSAEELALKTEPLAPGAPAIILFRQLDSDDNSTASTPRHEDNYIRIKILTQDGLRYASVEVPFLKNSEDIVNLKARTIMPDGSIVNFDGKILEKFLYQAREVKHFAKTFTVPDVQVGGIVEYYYTCNFHEDHPYESHWVEK
jgi:hypothetical protein